MSEVKFKKLDPIEGKTWVIGDVHGYVNTLKTVLQKLKLTTIDRVIFLGDLVDRGPDVKGVFDSIIDLEKKGIEVLCIKGNHEDMMQKSYIEEQGQTGFLKFIKRDQIKRSWLNMGGDSTMKSFNAKKMVDIDPTYFDFIENMYHYLFDENYYYVHAGFDFKKPEPFADVQSMMWIRDFAVDINITEGRKVVHGHTPLDIDFIKDVIDNPKRDHFIALDNGVSIDNMPNKGKLLAFETNSHQLLVQSKQD